MSAGAPTVLDERGRPCPLPIIALGRTMAGLSEGAIVELLSDDPAARYDVPAWCRMTGHTFVGEAPVEDAPVGEAPLGDERAAPSWRFVVRHA